jgi:tetratricopeptide (TPR) repeat protein
MMAENPFDVQKKQAFESLRTGHYTRALDAFRELLVNAEDDPHLHEGMGFALMYLRDYAPALKHFQRVVDLRPASATALINLGAVLNRSKEYVRAVDALQAAISKDRKSSEAYYNLGYSYRHLGQYHLAISAYRQAIRLKPHLPETYVKLADVYMDSGSFTLAIEHYRKALTIKPDFELAIVRLEEAQREQSTSQIVMSPFGRLVDENKLTRKSTGSAIMRFSQEQRQFDRTQTEMLGLTLENAARELLRHLNDQIQVQTAAIRTHVSKGQIHQLTLHRMQQQFRTYVRDFAKSRMSLKNKIAKLEVYEEMVRQQFDDEAR